MLAHAFGVVASPRVRNQATVGGVLADADYASDPPAVLAALGARAVLRSARGERVVAIGELILGFYGTCIEPDELLVEVRVRRPRTRPCTASSARARARTARASPSPRRATAARSASSSAPSPTGRRSSPTCGARDGSVIDPRATEIGRGYAERIAPIADARGSAAYRRRVTAVEVRRAVEALAA